MDERAVERLGHAVRHLALPAFRAYYSVEKLAGLLGWMDRLERISVVWDELPRRGVRMFDCGERGVVQQRYELEEVQGGDEEVVWLDVDGVVGERGGLGEYRGEMEQQWAVEEEVPERWRDAVAGEVRMPLVHVRARLWGMY